MLGSNLIEKKLPLKYYNSESLNIFSLFVQPRTAYATGLYSPHRQPVRPIIIKTHAFLRIK